MIESGKTHRCTQCSNEKQASGVECACVPLARGTANVVAKAAGQQGAGGECGRKAMHCGKQLVMMDVETNAAIGACFAAQADKPRIVCHRAVDEPATCKEPTTIVSAMGSSIASAGKSKIDPRRAPADPDERTSGSDAGDTGVRMPAAIADGSTSMMELAAITFAAGYAPARQGMPGPAAGPDEIAAKLMPQGYGRMLYDIGRVEHSVGNGLAAAFLEAAEAERPRTGSR